MQNYFYRCSYFFLYFNIRIIIKIKDLNLFQLMSDNLSHIKSEKEQISLGGYFYMYKQ